MNRYALYPSYIIDLFANYPLDYWHSLAIYSDGVFFYWGIYNDYSHRHEWMEKTPYSTEREAFKAGREWWQQEQRRDGGQA